MCASWVITSLIPNFALLIPEFSEKELIATCLTFLSSTSLASEIEGKEENN